MRFFTIFIVAFSVFYSNNTQAQGRVIVISRTDSLKLADTWNEFKQAVRLNDTVKIMELSTDSVDCALCLSFEQAEHEYTVPVRKFMGSLNEKVFDDHVWKAINEKSYSILAREFVDWQPANFDTLKYGNYTLYEINYVTYEKDEWGKGHEGQNYLFQFVNLNGVFKFTGVQTIP